ncbi:AVL9/DENND6 domain-containing protein, partial [Chytridium lagenaria]
AVLCVGFHHRNGPQVEYVTPAIPSGDAYAVETPVSLPSEWAFLPFLCLPDGAHGEFLKIESTSLIYVKPVKKNSATEVLFTVTDSSNNESLITKDPEMTRSKVQKAVVVLSSEPISYIVKDKLELITRSYFQQRDFTNTAILQA